MIMQRLERQETEEIRDQKMLNCELMVSNEIEDQDRQPTDNGKKPCSLERSPAHRQEAGHSLRVPKCLVYVWTHKDLIAPW